MIDCFIVGIIKAVMERNNIDKHFGSTLSLNHYIQEAIELGYLNEDKTLTEKAVLFYYKYDIQSLPDGRSYFWNKIWED